jgi:hypothetical protein
MAELLVYSTDDGTFLEFRTSTGKTTTIHLDSFTERLRGVAQRALRDWCKEARDDPDIDHELAYPDFIEGWRREDYPTEEVTDMADDNSNRGPADRGRVAGEQGYEVQYFAEKAWDLD